MAEHEPPSTDTFFDDEIDIIEIDFKLLIISQSNPSAGAAATITSLPVQQRKQPGDAIDFECVRNIVLIHQ